MSRWRAGACPVHGQGFVTDVGSPAPADAGYVAERCAVEDCAVRVARWPAHDAHHASFGWCAGPDEIHALLIKASDVDPHGAAPGRHARTVRVSYPLEPELE